LKILLITRQNQALGICGPVIVTLILIWSVPCCLGTLYVSVKLK